MTAPEPEPMGADGSASFDFSDLTANDAPTDAFPIASDVVTPDHTASAGMDDEPAPEPKRGRFGRKRAGASGAKGRPEKDRPEVPKVRAGSLVKPLTEMYTSVGMMLAPFDPVCSLVFIDNAKKCAESLDSLARENDAVRRAILALTQTSAWGGVLIAHLPVLLVITAHHGPKDVAERVAPLATMMAPNSAQAAAQQNPDRDAA